MTKGTSAKRTLPSVASNNKSRWAVFISLVLVSLYAYTTQFVDKEKIVDLGKRAFTPIETSAQGQQAVFQTSPTVKYQSIEEAPYLITDVEYHKPLYQYVSDEANATQLAALDSNQNDVVDNIFENSSETAKAPKNLRELNQLTNANNAQYVLAQNTGTGGQGGGAGGGGGGSGVGAQGNNPIITENKPDDTEPQAPAAVPVPPAIWLFGSALMGLVGLRRKV